MSDEPSLRAERTRAIKAEAREIGFDKVGVAPAAHADPEGHLAAWFLAGRHAGLDYLVESAETRADPRRFVPSARSVVALSMSYYWPEEAQGRASRRPIAKYARGMDYHRVLQRKVRRLRRFMLRLDPTARVGPSIDYSPVLEREWAQRAGIAWIGKSTMAIAQDLGTYTFLAALITTTELDPDRPHVDRCGSCTACIDACPTGAIVAPHELDARRCITYWNVEHKGPLSSDTPPFHGWIAGCDVCQDVCPWNKFARPTREQRFAPRPELLEPDLVRWVRDPEATAQAIAGTALERTGAAAIARNAERVLAEREAQDLGNAVDNLASLMASKPR